MPSSADVGMKRSVAPSRCARSCHGTMFEWCSITEITISSPACRLASPQDCATRLIDSVVLRVKTTSCVCRDADVRAPSSRVQPRTASVALRQRMHATVDIRVDGLVVAHKRIDHRHAAFASSPRCPGTPAACR